MNEVFDLPAVRVAAPRGPIAIDVRPPGSKSITNRALLLAAIAEGRSRIRGWLNAEDTKHMRACLAQLGVDIMVEHDALLVRGRNGPLAPADRARLEVGTAGTVARFLSAAVAASPGQAVMDGSARMRERPMNELFAALARQGAKIHCLNDDGRLPAVFGPGSSLSGGTIRLARPASSQFVSALLLGGILARSATTVVLEAGTPAKPYVDMTVAMIDTFGGRSAWRTHDTLEVVPSPLSARDYEVEPDASAASYLLAAAAIHGGRTTVRGLGSASLQGDAGFAAILERMGAVVMQEAMLTSVEGTGNLHGIDVDLDAMPDMTLTVAVLALFCDGPTRITGVEVLRHHESDRIAAAAAELRKLGARVDEHADGLTIEPPRSGPTRDVAIDTYRDHRMAMAFALVGDVIVRDPACVAKTYPEYFNTLGETGMFVEPA